MNARILVLLSVLFILFAVLMQPTPPPQVPIANGPFFGQPLLFLSTPVNNPMISGEWIREFYDPTDNHMGDRSPARPANAARDLSDAMSDASLYQDSFNHVALHNGAFIHTELVHNVPSLGFDFNLLLTYNSKEAGNLLDAQGLGIGWCHNYGAFILHNSTSDRYTLHNGFGMRIHFDPSSQANYYTPVGGGFDGSYSTLQVIPVGGGPQQNDIVKIRNRFGMVTTFKRPGTFNITNPNLFLMREVEDPNENILKINYTGNEVLVDSVDDTYGRNYDFFYNVGTGVLETVTDFAGRVITFNVNGTPKQLKSIGLVEVDNTTTNNNFVGADRKTIEFTYYDGAVDPPNFMKTMKRPNEVATAGKDPLIEIDYFPTITNCPGFVSQLTIGNDNYHGMLGASSPTISYVWNGNQVTVTDREGHATVYNFSITGHVTSVVEPTETGTATTSFQYTTTREVNKVTYDRGNFISLSYATAPVTNFMYNRGNVTQITFNRNTIASDQDILNFSFTYENLYNNCVTVTDPRSLVTSYTTDYFEQTNTKALGVK